MSEKFGELMDGLKKVKDVTKENAKDVDTRLQATMTQLDKENFVEKSQAIGQLRGELLRLKSTITTADLTNNDIKSLAGKIVKYDSKLQSYVKEYERKIGEMTDGGKVKNVLHFTLGVLIAPSAAVPPHSSGLLPRFPNWEAKEGYSDLQTVLMGFSDSFVEFVTSLEALAHPEMRGLMLKSLKDLFKDGNFLKMIKSSLAQLQKDAVSLDHYTYGKMVGNLILTLSGFGTEFKLAQGVANGSIKISRETLELALKQATSEAIKKGKNVATTTVNAAKVTTNVVKNAPKVAAQVSRTTIAGAKELGQTALRVGDQITAQILKGMDMSSPQLVPALVEAGGGAKLVAGETKITPNILKSVARGLDKVFNNLHDNYDGARKSLLKEIATKFTDSNNKFTPEQILDEMVALSTTMEKSLKWLNNNPNARDGQILEIFVRDNSLLPKEVKAYYLKLADENGAKFVVDTMIRKYHKMYDTGFADKILKLRNLGVQENVVKGAENVTQAALKAMDNIKTPQQAAQKLKEVMSSSARLRGEFMDYQGMVMGAWEKYAKNFGRFSSNMDLYNRVFLNMSVESGQIMAKRIYGLSELTEKDPKQLLKMTIQIINENPTLSAAAKSGLIQEATKEGYEEFVRTISFVEKGIETVGFDKINRFKQVNDQLRPVRAQIAYLEENFNVSRNVAKGLDETNIRQAMDLMARYTLEGKKYVAGSNGDFVRVVMSQ